jgi:hypothetical protein
MTSTVKRASLSNPKTTKEQGDCSTTQKQLALTPDSHE